MKPISLYHVGDENRRLVEDFCLDLRRVVASGRFVLGPELAAFESGLGVLLDGRHVLGVNSGTDALVLALAALGIGPGDEVITSPFTFFATAEAIARAGATPVFADVDPGTLCLSEETCAAAITGRTRAVIAVHLFGHCGDLDALAGLCRARGLHLVEDACQALGATWRGRPLGSIGDVACFSFYPTKNLAALGDGGAVATGDPGIAARLGRLRNHGRDPDGRFLFPGFNSRMDEVQAAFLGTKLGLLAAGNARRAEIARRYDRAFAGGARVVRGHADCGSSWHQYAVLVDRRDDLRAFLAGHAVETGCYYRTPLHLEPAFAQPGLAMPEAERASREILTLPVHPGMSDADVDRVAALTKRFFGENGKA